MGVKISAIGAHQPKVYASNQIWCEKFAAKIALKENKSKKTIVSMACSAIADCMKKSDIDIAKVDLIIHATNFTNGEIDKIRTEVGAINADFYELTEVACTSAMVAMSQVNSFIKTKKYKNILACYGNPGDLATAVLFSQSKGDSGFLAFHHKTLAQFVEIFDFQPIERGVMTWPQTDQDRYWANQFYLVHPKWLPALYQINTTFIPEAIRQTLDSINLDFKDIQWLITHQAGGVLELWRDLVGFDQKCHLDTFSEVDSSNISYTLMKALDKNAFSLGDKILLVSVGSGVHITTAVWQW